MPAVFVWAYDLPWRRLLRVGEQLAERLGEAWCPLPAFWAWNVLPGSGGWRAHRDNLQPNNTGAHVDVTLWVALSNADVDTGCIHVLPRSQDQAYSALASTRGLRPLATRAGDGWLWDQRLLHWGGNVREHAPLPRRSLALEFRRARATAVANRFLVPSLAQRLRLIAAQVIRYRHLHSLAPQVSLDAVRLRRELARLAVELPAWQ
jgi:ectoine hydroxylase-related dioxygenase (phytanoyl-CoA dioxygenase family)